MKPSLMLRDAGGKMLLPLGIVFFASALTPVVLFIAPSGHHLFVAMTLPGYNWVWMLPVFSGALFFSLAALLEGKRN